MSNSIDLPEDPNPPDDDVPLVLRSRREFLKLAVLCEGGLVVLAYVLGWFMGIDPLETFRFDSAGVLLGVGATVPMFALFLISYHLDLAPLRRIREFLEDALGPPLALCRWYDLVFLAATAGFCEEILFRGVLHPWFDGLFGGLVPGAGLAGSNIVFGLAHLITPLYAVLAAFIGAYLGALMEPAVVEQFGGGPNVLAPMIAHGLYDYLAFLFVIRAYRKRGRVRPACGRNAFHAPGASS